MVPIEAASTRTLALPAPVVDAHQPAAAAPLVAWRTGCRAFERVTVPYGPVRACITAAGPRLSVMQALAVVTATIPTRYPDATASVEIARGDSLGARAYAPRSRVPLPGVDEDLVAALVSDPVLATSKGSCPAAPALGGIRSSTGIPSLGLRRAVPMGVVRCGARGVTAGGLSVPLWVQVPGSGSTTVLALG